MEYKSVSEAVAALQKFQHTLSAYNHALGVLYLDATTAAPADTWEGRGKTIEILSGVVYDLTTRAENEGLYAYLESHWDELDDMTRRQVEVLRKEYDRSRKVPAKEYIAYSVLLNEAQGVWAKAKSNNDWESFRPVLEKIVEYNRKFALYYDPGKQPYDVLLDMYEEGMTMEKLDAFFQALRSEIVPLLNKITQAPQIDNPFQNAEFPLQQQRELSGFLMQVLGLNRAHCGIAETEHPYTTNFNNKDVRITTHYDEHNFLSSMYSVIHEGGHALYELGADDVYNYTALQGGVSMGIHESQSRFYENIIGRSPAFIHAVYPKICQLFPQQMKDVTEQMLYRAVNRVEPSLIRIEADELTFCLHIMVRYQIEKELIGGSLEVRDVPKRWNELYQEYLGIDVPSDREGCLQDSHWSGGSIGYFPSYALGSAYGAQFLAKMRQELGDIDADVAKGDLSKVTGWLRENIHQYASFKKPAQILKDVVGEFDSRYFIDYLKEKFSRLYDLT